MPFNRNQVSELLVSVGRRCCICHRFCGVKIETDHIVPKEQGGNDDIENAIPVCFECHAEIHSYNDQHPRGRKFLPDELRAHKTRWLQTCRNQPEVLVAAVRTADVGPLQALIDELEFNKAVSNYAAARFADEQFRRAIHFGVVSTLNQSLQSKILDAYAAMSHANNRIAAEANQDGGTRLSGLATDEARRAVREALPRINAALDCLLSFLGAEKPLGN